MRADGVGRRYPSIMCTSGSACSRATRRRVTTTTLVASAICAVSERTAGYRYQPPIALVFAVSKAKRGRARGRAQQYIARSVYSNTARPCSSISSPHSPSPTANNGLTATTLRARAATKSSMAAQEPGPGPGAGAGAGLSGTATIRAHHLAGGDSADINRHSAPGSADSDRRTAVATASQWCSSSVRHSLPSRTLDPTRE
jgi:hypothetical protein